MVVSVLLVDDAAPIRAVVRLALRARGGFAVAEAGNAADALAAAMDHPPDVVVLDLGLPDLTGQELLGRLRALVPGVRVVVYTATPDARRAERLSGIEGVIGKNQDLSYLINLLDDVARRTESRASLLLDPRPESVAIARRFLRARCVEWGCADIIEDAQLVLSELVTNALVHAGGSCEVIARLSPGALHLDVLDGGSGTPDPQLPSGLEDHGRGLMLVGGLCVAWGIDAAPGGKKLVWAELARPGASGPRVSG